MGSAVGASSLSSLGEETGTGKDTRKGIGTKKEIVLLVATAAAGKSTYAAAFVAKVAPDTYIIVNQDTLGTRPKCLEAARQALEKGLSVVVDNTNYTRSKDSDKDGRR